MVRGRAAQLACGTADVTVGSAGTVRFQCMIHPWMHSTVEVRDRGDGGED